MQTYLNKLYASIECKIEPKVTLFKIHSREILIEYLKQRQENNSISIIAQKSYFYVDAFLKGSNPLTFFDQPQPSAFTNKDAEIFKNQDILTLANNVFSSPETDLRAKYFLEINKNIDALCFSGKNKCDQLSNFDRELKRLTKCLEKDNSTNLVTATEKIGKQLDDLVFKVNNGIHYIITEIFFILQEEAKPYKEELKATLRKINSLAYRIENNKSIYEKEFLQHQSLITKIEAKKTWIEKNKNSVLISNNQAKFDEDCAAEYGSYDYISPARFYCTKEEMQKEKDKLSKLEIELKTFYLDFKKVYMMEFFEARRREERSLELNKQKRSDLEKKINNYLYLFASDQNIQEIDELLQTGDTFSAYKIIYGILSKGNNESEITEKLDGMLDKILKKEIFKKYSFLKNLLPNLFPQNLRIIV